MSMYKRIGILLAAWIIVGGVTEFVEHPNIRGIPALTSAAEAVVGRPLTPVSVRRSGTSHDPSLRGWCV
jgi:hypothetical protein